MGATNNSLVKIQDIKDLGGVGEKRREAKGSRTASRGKRATRV